MKNLMALMTTLFLSISANSAQTSCAIIAKAEALKIGRAQDLSRSINNIDVEIESSKMSSRIATIILKSSFTSTEEHEFIRIEMKLDSETCEILKSKIIQDSRK
jgi:hypothetical protein